MAWVKSGQDLTLSKQCRLLQVTRSVIYAQQKRLQEKADEKEKHLLRLIDEEYARHPFYGSRRMVIFLSSYGYVVNRKHVQRLMRKLGLMGMAPGPNTSKSHPEHKVYPYLLRGVDVNRPNQVWSTDITYLQLPQGFVYLVAIIDWYSRKVLSWRHSNTMEAHFCVDALEQAIRQYGKPEIFNSDQGAQFTSTRFTGVLLTNKIKISMDGRGRALDNIYIERLWRSVKYEDVYLKKYDNMAQLLLGLTNYFTYYNQVRPHQSLGYLTPDVVHQKGIGGGARIVDKFGAAPVESSPALRSGDDSTGATTQSKARSKTETESTTETEATSTPKSKTGQRRAVAIEKERIA